MSLPKVLKKSKNLSWNLNCLLIQFSIQVNSALPLDQLYKDYPTKIIQNILKLINISFYPKEANAPKAVFLIYFHSNYDVME